VINTLSNSAGRIINSSTIFFYIKETETYYCY